MDPWIRFFLGTPRRFCVTLGAFALVVVVLDPCILALAVSRFIIAVTPLLGPALTIFIVFVAFRMILGGGRHRH